jgi:hypothetical protein
MSKVQIGPHTRPDPHAPEEGAETFDREINIRGIVWTGIVLVVVTVVSQILMWGMLKGFGKFDERHDVPPPVMAEARKQPPPPEPQLQTSPPVDMRAERAQEDHDLGHAAWVDRQQGAVRLPIDVAMQVIASRGVGAELVGGTPGAPAAPAAAPAPGTAPTAPAALVQSSRQPSQAGTATPQTPQPEGGQKPPSSPERR